MSLCCSGENCVKAICRWLSIFADYWYMAKSKSIQIRFIADLQKQVKGVGRNVNQITRLAHISGKVSLETLRQISAAQEKIEQQLERLN